MGTEMITEKKEGIKSQNNFPLDNEKSKKFIYKRYIKRPLDFILSLIAIIILSPVMLIIALLVRIKLGKPIIFKQQRPGLYGKIFTLY